MAHYAEIINGVVQQVLVTDNALTDQETLDWLNTYVSTNMWLKCSYNANIRGTYPGPGFSYDAELDVFVAPPEDEPEQDTEDLDPEPE